MYCVLFVAATLSLAAACLSLPKFFTNISYMIQKCLLPGDSRATRKRRESYSISEKKKSRILGIALDEPCGNLSELTSRQT